MYNVSAFRHLPRQDGFPHGRIAQYEFYVSLDGVNWGPPVAVGTLANVATEQEVGFAPKTGQYRPAPSVVRGGGAAVHVPGGVERADVGEPAAERRDSSPGGQRDDRARGDGGFQRDGERPGEQSAADLPVDFRQWEHVDTGRSATGPVCQPGHLHRDLYCQGCLGNADPVPATRTVTVQSVRLPTT